jgi:hypothetical protein
MSNIKTRQQADKKYRADVKARRKANTARNNDNNVLREHGYDPASRPTNHESGLTHRTRRIASHDERHELWVMAEAEKAERIKVTEAEMQAKNNKVPCNYGPNYGMVWDTDTNQWIVEIVLDKFEITEDGE